MKLVFIKPIAGICGLALVLVSVIILIFLSAISSSSYQIILLTIILCSLFIVLLFFLSHLSYIKYQQVEQLSRDKEVQLSRILVAARMGIWDWNLITNQVILSQGNEQLLGLKTGDFNSSYATLVTKIHPEDRAAFEQAISHAIQAKVDYQHEYRVVWVDGSVHWIEAKGQAIYNQSGDAVRVRGTVRDISAVYDELYLRQLAEAKIQILNVELEQRVLERTSLLSEANNELYKKISERTLLEQKLHSSEIQMRAVFEAMTDIVLVINTKTWSINVAPTNPICAHKSATDIISKTIDMIFNNEKEQSSLNPIQQALEVEETINFDYSLLVGDSEVWFTASISPLVNDSVIWVARDITERRAIETMKNEFISIVSHELRTPLTSIRGSLGLLATGLLNNQPQRVKRLIEIASLDTERLVRLVNDILDLERLESGKVTLVKEYCDVAMLMEQSVDAMQSLAEKDNIAISIFPISAQIWAAPDSIIQVLANLLSNAIKFSHDNSAIALCAEVQNDEILFQVKDQGRGIPPDKLELVFGRFQQVDASDSRSKGGTGLGLAICQSIIEQHGGRIWVESVVGSGSTFYFTLPTSARYSNI